MIEYGCHPWASIAAFCCDIEAVRQQVAQEGDRDGRQVGPHLHALAPGRSCAGRAIHGIRGAEEQPATSRHTPSVSARPKAIRATGILQVAQDADRGRQLLQLAVGMPGVMDEDFEGRHEGAPDARPEGALLIRRRRQLGDCPVAFRPWRPSRDSRTLLDGDQGQAAKTRAASTASVGARASCDCGQTRQRGGVVGRGVGDVRASLTIYLERLELLFGLQLADVPSARTSVRRVNRTSARLAQTMHRLRSLLQIEDFLHSLPRRQRRRDQFEP